MVENRWCVTIVLALMMAAMTFPVLALPRANRTHRDLQGILARITEEARHLKTVSAELEYTHVTVLVDDHSTESGRFYLRNPKNPEMLVRFVEPDASTVLFKRNRLEMYRPKINQIVEYNLGSKRRVAQQFLLLGFGTNAKSLSDAYSVKLDQEVDLDGAATAVLDLTPRDSTMLRYFTRIQVWICEESWLPVQQKFVSPNGDYSIARYSAVKVNENLPDSTFRIAAAFGVERVKMN